MLTNDALSRRHIPDALTEPGNTRHVVRARFQTVRQILRHGLQDALRAGAAGKERQPGSAAEQKPRPLRPQQALVPRHGNERGAQRLQIQRKHTGGLRRVHDQRDAKTRAKFRNLRDRQHKSIDIGHMRTHRRTRTRQQSAKIRQHGFLVKQPSRRDAHLRSALMQRPRNGVVLIPGDYDRVSRLYQRVDRQI